MKAILSLIPLGAWLTAAVGAQTVQFEGRVIAYDGTPIAGAAVACATKYDLDTPTLLDRPPTVSDAAGRFTIEAEKPAAPAIDTLYLHVASPGMAAVMRSLDWQKPELGDIVLTPGQRLFGRVRDAAGNPLAGVRVVAIDLLEQGTALRSGKHHGFHCATRSEASGIFKLPCALPNGTRLEFQADGFANAWIEPVSAGTPLEMTMRETGWLQGRALDPDGRSIADAEVRVACELRAAPRPVLTGADGSFRVPLARAGRWRITIYKRLDGQVLEGRTDVMTGPRENLEIIVRATAIAAGETMAIRAVTKADRTPVPAFRAAALWEQYANTNASYREYRLRGLLRQPIAAEDGTAKVPGPGQNQAEIGIIRILADGFAPATLTGVEWRDPGEPAAEPLVVELEPEARVRGVVRDEGSAQPVAGARVWARPKPNPNEGQFPETERWDAVVTGVDGSFDLGGLGEGAWQLLVEHDNHPSAQPTDLELATAEQRADVVLTLPSGATVAGKLTGIAIAGGARVFLAPIARQVFGESNQTYFSTYSNQSTDQSGIPIESDGSFAFRGVALANHQIVVRLPSPPRLGGDLFLPIEPFRVRAAGIDRQFDCSEDQPGTIRGKVAFAHARTEYADLVVIAQIVVNQQPFAFSPYNQRYPGPRSFVDRDGTYAIRVGPGDYRLTVVDLASSVPLHTEEQVVAVASGKTMERDLTLALTRIELSLAAAADVTELAAVERVEVRFVPKAQLDTGRKFGNNDQYDSRSGLYWPVGAETLSVVLPAGSATFLCRNEVALLRVDNQRHQNAPLGRLELEVGAGDTKVLPQRIEVAGPPEIPADEAEKPQGDAAADGELKGRAP